MKEQFKAALKSLPWYLVGGFLFGPLILAPFTAGASLFLYIAPFTLLKDRGKYVSDSAYAQQQLMSVLLPLAPGLIAWILRQFWRFAFHVWWMNRSSNFYRSSGNITPRT